MRFLPRVSVRLALPFALAISAGVFLAVAGRALSWSDTTTLVVGVALAAMLGLLGVPLALLPLASMERPERVTRRVPASARLSSSGRPVSSDRVMNPYDSVTASTIQQLDPNPSSTSLRDLLLVPPGAIALNATFAPANASSGEVNVAKAEFPPLREVRYEATLNSSAPRMNISKVTSASS